MKWINWFRRQAATSKVENGRYQYGNDHLIELRDVVKTYETVAGSFDALKNIDL